MVSLVSTREVALYFGFGDQLVVNFEPCKLELFYQFLSFNAFQVLKWFSHLLSNRVTCVIFECMINTDVWQAMVAHVIKSQKNCSKPP